MLREVVLECFSKLAKSNLVPIQIYEKLCYWLDSDLYSDNERVKDTTTLLHMIQYDQVYKFGEHNVNENLFKIGLREDYEDVGMTLFTHLYASSEEDGYRLPPFVHWESWYNNKCTIKSGLTKAKDRWSKKPDSDGKKIAMTNTTNTKVNSTSKHDISSSSSVKKNSKKGGSARR
jgi:hypothetical protein